MPISLSGSLNLSGSLTTTGTITATTLVVQTITSSISSITGSTNFGSLSSDTHKFTGSLNVTGALYVATGSVGIGTISPVGPLHVEKNQNAGTIQYLINSNASSSAYSHLQIGTTSAGDNTTYGIVQYYNPTNAFNIVAAAGAVGGLNITHNSAYPITFSTSGSERMRISSTGAVVAGPTGSSSTSKLTSYLGSSVIAAGTNNDGLRLQVQSYDVTARNTIVWGQNGSDATLARFGVEWSGTSMDFVWRDMYNNNATGSTEIMRVKGNGNVGIGTNSPSRLLTLKNSSDGFNGISFQSYATASENAYIRFDQSDDTLRISNKQNYATGGTIFYTNDTEKMRITSGGYLRLTQAGIQFNNDTADANSLDDYEEGTWTPVVKLGSTTNSSSTAIGVYTKIGRVVYIQCTITGITKSGSGALSINGLPFTVGVSATFGDTQANLRWSDISSSGIIIPYFNAGSTSILLQNFGSSGYTGAISDSACSATYQLYGISGFYML